MINLEKLSVSLTKEGAYKVAQLIEKFPSDQIMDNIKGKISGINIDRPQALKNLSAYPHGKIPKIWDEVKLLGTEAINDLVFIAIIFSHHRLIKLMIKNSKNDKTGILYRTDFETEKEFTNIAHDIEQLGLSINHPHDYISFNLSRIFSKFELIPLIIELISMKLTTAGWGRQTELLDEAIKHEFFKVLSVSEKYFVNWLSKGYTDEILSKSELIEDDITIKKFEFKNGHVEKSEGKTIINRSSSKLKSTLLHNEIQNSLYLHLVNQYSSENVGTEIDPGNGTSVDIVRKDENNYIFYEIKTEKSVRICIRQALTQLLEYSCWPDRLLANQLIIVSQSQITEQAKLYIKHIRETFNIPIYYQQFNIQIGVLGEIY